MPDSLCMVCGQPFTYVWARFQSRPTLICSPECKRERHRQYSRAYTERRRELLGTPRTHGSVYCRLHCTIDGCEGKYYAKGMCNMHYAREWRASRSI